MPTVSRGIPAHPHLSVPKQQARDLLNQCQALMPEALERVRRQRLKFKSLSDLEVSKAVKLSDAQFVIAREYGLASWAQLKQRIVESEAAQMIDRAIRSGDAAAVTKLLSAHPQLLEIPVVSGNWGPPMSHAANMGNLDMVRTIAALGAKDFQHAFERALLH
ncbi:MAG TPA: hypothetical protein VGC95_02070, partial [Chitinophagaceae bacterium]